MREKYHGGEQVHAPNGLGMQINHVGQRILQSPTSNIQLKNILYVPKASKNLVSVNRLTRDNNVFLEFHRNHCSIKK